MKTGKIHIPVLADEISNYLNCREGKTYLDGTLGYGGHTREILKKIGSSGSVIGIDQDNEALKSTKQNLNRFGNIIFVHDNFSNIKKILQERNIKSIDGAIFDLGVSSAQIDKADRGFSFMKNGSLDMRMNRDSDITASNLVNTLSRNELLRILYEYGEEKWASRIVQRIIAFRENEEIRETLQLAEIVEKAIPGKFHPKNIHPATKTFQALRIAVNDELSTLKKGLQNTIDVLSHGARFCVISFHSLEDRIVKKIFRYNATECICSPDIPMCICDKLKTVNIITRKPLSATDDEVSKNIRSRSAKLRVVEKL